MGVRRVVLWPLVLPFAGVSVLVGHWAAYRLAGIPDDGLHEYLRHAPQLVAILATLGLVGLACDARARRSSPVPVALLGAIAFAAQEHVERLVHTGHLPFLLTSPVFLIGIALQLPLAVLIWVAARSVAGGLRPRRRRPAPCLALLPLVLAPVSACVPCGAAVCAVRGRAPPLL